MAAALEDVSISYEDLADIEREFEDVETEIIRQQVALTEALYTRRTKLLSQIPTFWPLVLEQAPPEIDQYIHPNDSNVLLSSLTSLSVSHFDLANNPRSIAISLAFAPNEYFENEVLEKKFWYRKAKDGWSGLVSEPVPIKWKADKDLTGGLLDLVVKAWEKETKNGGKTKSAGLTPEQKALKKKIESTGMGGVSFFGWFGFIGRPITEEENQEAIKLGKEKVAARKAGKPAPACCDHDHENGHKHEEDENDDDDEESLEIFPDGDELAIAFAEDLWPSAIKYFTQAQEQDGLSDLDFESDYDEDDDDEEAPDLVEAPSADDSDGPPAKKQRSK
ncbi:nucleosome assembly protein [Bisporella sp. PMI_857]|nr:nucleosome assembly protein [Bisporella sp. PMI_857]